MEKLGTLIISELYMLFNLLLFFSKKANKIYFKISTFILLIILTFQKLGIDLPGYKKMFEDFLIKDWKSLFLEKSPVEYSFRILINSVKHFSTSSSFFIFIISFINVILLYHILKNKRYNFLYLYFYVIINFYLTMTNYLRQQLSLLFFLSGIFILKRGIKKYFLYVLSFLFHKSSIILGCIPLCIKFFKLKKFYIRNMIVFFFTGFLLYKIFYLVLINYNGNNFYLLYFRGYFLYFRKDIVFPTLLHKILFVFYIGYPFFLNFIFLIIIKRKKFINNVDKLFYKMMIIGVYYCAFLFGLGVFSLGIFEIGMRSTYYFFVGNFYVIGNYIILRKNRVVNIFLFSLIVKLLTVFIILQINRAIGIF